MGNPRNVVRWSCVMLLLAVRSIASAADVAPVNASEPLSSAQSAAQATAQPATDRTSSHDFTSDFSLLEEYRLRIVTHRLPSAQPLGEPPSGKSPTDQHLRLLAEGQVTGYEDHFRATLSGALWLDLDGGSAPGEASVLATQYDNARPFVAAYELSAEWRRSGALDHLRLGRQASEHGMPLTFDGASMGLRVLDRQLLLFGFGGRTVHFFETKPGLFENWVGSVGAVYQPSTAVAIELDTRVTQEQVLDFDRAQRSRITNGSYGLSAAMRSDALYAKLFTRGIDDRPSHVGGNFQFHQDAPQIGLDARLVAQVTTLGEIVESENPFFSLLGPSLPHARFRFEAWKGFRIAQQTNLSFHLGWRGRQLLNHSEQPFNRNTQAIYLHTRLDDVFEKGIFLGGTVEYNFTPQSLSGERLLALGGFTGYSRGDVRTEVGTYFQQFKINYYQAAEELHNARTVYGSVAYRLVSWLELRARYEIDIFDRYLQSFYLSARQDF